MVTINLWDFYPWYVNDEFVEVSDAVAEELLADKRYQKAHPRRARRNRAQRSLDADDGIARSATHPSMSPEAVLEYKCRFCHLCAALNSLPEIQGRRVEARYLLGKSQKEIAEAEGVSENAVSKSIDKGLAAMKKYLKNKF